MLQQVSAWALVLVSAQAWQQAWASAWQQARVLVFARQVLVRLVARLLELRLAERASPGWVSVEQVLAWVAQVLRMQHQVDPHQRAALPGPQTFAPV